MQEDKTSKTMSDLAEAIRLECRHSGLSSVQIVVALARVMTIYADDAFENMAEK